MKKISTVIFDFDGVIADTLPFTFKKIHEMAHVLNANNKTEKEIIKEIRSKDWKELLKTGMNLSWFKIPFVLMMVRRMQLELGKEIHNIKFFPGMKKLLNDLKKNNYKLGVISSNLKENIIRFFHLNDIGYINYIEAGTNTLLAGKADLIEKYFKDSKSNKKETIYIGDEIRDVNACKKVGLRIIGVSWGLHEKKVLKKTGADYIAEKPSDILKIISKN